MKQLKVAVFGDICMLAVILLGQCIMKLLNKKLINMEFEITRLDKKLLIQTLFSHSAPLGFGELEYDHRKKWGENVDGLTDDECEFILYKFNQLDAGNIRLLDYYKGKPMKLNFDKKASGRVLADSDGYDTRNGKYRFFEALLDIFFLDEILITKKGFRQFFIIDLQEQLKRPKEQEAIFKNILKNTIKKENEYGKYWEIDDNNVSYTPLFMQL